MTAAIQRTAPRTAQRPFEPRGAAYDLLFNRAGELLVEGPAGTGKSRACVEKMHLCALNYPGMRGLMARKTRRSMTESILVTYEQKVLPEGSPIKTGPQRMMRQAYLYPNGSTLVVGGLDDPDKIMSTEYDLIYVPEATEATEDDWEKLTTRLRNGVMPYQQIIGDCNPGGPSHWLNQRCIRKQTERLRSRHGDNPTVTDQYLETLRRLTGARRARLFEGRWAAQEGLVYVYDADVHLLDQMPEGWQSWRKIRVIDFGYTNPFVCQWWAIDGDGRMYLYREIYMSQRTVRVHAQQIKDLSGDERYDATIADHDAEDRATLRECGISTVAADKSVSTGIQMVQDRMKIAGDTKPRLFLVRDCLVEADPVLVAARKPTCTEQEIDGYIWPKGIDGKPDKEAPVKIDDHGMDAMRYAAMYCSDLRPNPAHYVSFVEF
jgi:PBSX family phage terminase large subunit